MSAFVFPSIDKVLYGEEGNTRLVIEKSSPKTSMLEESTNRRSSVLPETVVGATVTVLNASAKSTFPLLSRSIEKVFPTGSYFIFTSSPLSFPRMKERSLFFGRVKPMTTS